MAKTKKEPFTFTGIAKVVNKGTFNEQVSVWTDGVAASCDTDRHCAYRLIAGKTYKVTIEQIDTKHEN